MELHYQIAGKYKAQAHLIGSNTVKLGVEMFGGTVPKETKRDFEKPKRSNKLPYWIIPDTRGSLTGILHTCRRFQFCRDVVVLVSESTPKTYLDYLEERNYDFHVVGADHVDLRKSLDLLAEKFNVKRVLTDTGRVLGNLLLEQRLAAQVSLLVHPFIVGAKAYSIFGNINQNIKLKLQKEEALGRGFIWIVYNIKN